MICVASRCHVLLAAALNTEHNISCRYCWETPTVWCLATMAIAQGLCTNLLEYAWKINLQAYCTDAASFTAFLGDVASYTGIATVVSMLVAPTMFKTLGWRRTARATPTFLLYAGGPFFTAAFVYQVLAHKHIATHLAQPLLLALSVCSTSWAPCLCFSWLTADHLCGLLATLWHVKELALSHSHQLAISTKE